MAYYHNQGRAVARRFTVLYLYVASKKEVWNAHIYFAELSAQLRIETSQWDMYQG